MTDDADLLLAAQQGDIAGLGLLLERHRPALYATALQFGAGATDAQDAVQETFLVALRKIDQIRDPHAFGPWLGAIVRNVCRMRDRRRREVSMEDVDSLLEERLFQPSLEEHLESLATREWVWTALAELPEPLRVTAMLRYFGSYASYEEIALILGVPVGTVRSRLHQARNRLATALLGTAESDDRESRIHLDQRTRFWAAAWEEFNSGKGYDRWMSALAATPEWFFSDGTILHGRGFFIDQAEGDLVTGTKLHLTRVLASQDLLIMENTYQNPPDDPLRCPPAITWVGYYRGSLIRRMHLYFAPRLEPERVPK